MTYETLIHEKKDGLGIVTLHRPDRLNAINATLLQELELVFMEIAADEEVKAVILTGGPKAFCAGADIKEVAAAAVPGPIPMLGSYDVFNQIERLDKVVIAAVCGYAVGGGCELAMACDLRIASTTAQFGQPEVKLGAIPLGGGTQRLPRLIGPTKAKELLFTGEFIDAKEALRLGLVNRVVPPESLLDEAKQMARSMTELPPLAVRGIKSCVNVGMQMDLHSAVEYEARIGTIVANSEDRLEGMRAFVEKRKPVFKGR